MAFWKKLLGKPGVEEKVQFFSGWEVKLDGGPHCEAFLLTQCVDKETALASSTYIQLSFGPDDLLQKGQLFFDGKEETEGHLYNDLQFEKAVGTMKFHPRTPNKVFAFMHDDRGVHQLGGELPPGFQLPAVKLRVPFQYLGYLDNKDEAFAWLPFRLHLICPVFLNISQVFIDYTDPLNPVLLNETELKVTASSYEELNSGSRIIFEKVKFSAVPSYERIRGLGHTGVPDWIQFPDIPRCPKTNRVMKFVCQLDSDAGVGVKESNVIPSSGFMASYFEEMNFWGDGNLFVFIEPSSRIACYFIQNT